MPYMTATNSSRSDSMTQGTALILAPALLAASTFFWVDGEYGVTSATLGTMSMFFWIPALTGVFGLLRNQTPRYATYGLWVAVFGCISGVCFMFLGYLTAVFQISHADYLRRLAEYPLSSQLLLFGSGPIFPLSLLVLGASLFRTKAVPAWIAILLCVGAVAFPASRIPRAVWIAHLADLALLVPCAAVGVMILRSKPAPDETIL